VVPTKGPEWISAEVSSIRSATGRPFAVAFITQFIPMVLPLFEATLAEQVPAVMFSFGDPKPWVARAKTAGAVYGPDLRKWYYHNAFRNHEMH
jgi:nitronate monooxygenase